MDGLEQDRLLLHALCKFAGMTPSRVATEAGLSSTTILRPYNGSATTRLSAPTLEKLQARFPDFPGWHKAGVSDDRLAFRGSPPEHDPDLVGIEEIDLRYGLGATYLDVPVVSEVRQFSRAWLRLFTSASPANLFWTVGDGDSMEPTIHSGEVILIDRSQTTPSMGDGIWAIAYGEVGMVKRLCPLPDGTVEITSDNPVIKPRIAVDGELHVIGRVIAVVRKL
ncbi:MAG: S24 family peptidase [Pseudomonadota bacterium]|nr:S24 family peptidase [Pseudomonadota bacterium]